MNDNMMNKVESLKILLVSHATGSTGDEVEYKKLRRELIASPRINKILPRVVHLCRDLEEFWTSKVSNHRPNGAHTNYNF